MKLLNGKVNNPVASSKSSAGIGIKNVAATVNASLSET